MNMKYVVVRTGEKEMMFLFSEEVTHARMAEIISHIRSGFPGDRNWDCLYIDAKPVSGGFFDGVKFCGMSESLKVKARPVEDLALFRMGGMCQISR